MKQGAGHQGRRRRPRARPRPPAQAPSQVRVRSRDSKAEPTAKPTADEQGPTPKAGTNASTTGRAGREVGDRRQGGSERPSRRRQGRGSASPRRTQAGADSKAARRHQGRRGRQDQRSGEPGQRRRSVNLTTEQKTKIRTTVLQSSSAPKVSRSSINFNISVGTVVPRTRPVRDGAADHRRDPSGVARLQLLHRR